MGLEVFERGEFPKWARVRQRLDSQEIPAGQVGAAIAEQFAKPGIGDTITPGQRVAITAGSRGIDRIAEVIGAVVAEVKKHGGEPWVVPAMGSHAGATAEGQVELLHHYGITEETMGCPIRSSMEVVQLGTVEDGVPVYFDKTVYEQADAVIPVGRVKAHTDFRGPIESGLCKMMAIGLGKQKGADTLHAKGFAEFHHLIPTVANLMLSRVNIPFGIALVENGFSHLAFAEAVPAQNIVEREIELLVIAREKMAKLPGDRIDVLLLDYFGKNISGSGADPNVTSRDPTGLLWTAEHPAKPDIHRIIVRDLTEETEGNAAGIGMLDIALRQAVNKIDFERTYMNQITAKMPSGSKVPLTVENDRQALYIAIASGIDLQAETAKIARVSSTKDIEEMFVSEPLLNDLLRQDLVDQLDELRPIAFDENGMFVEET